MSDNVVKICFAASSGGHFEQLMMLHPLMQRHDCFILTEQTSFKINTNNIKKFEVKQVNRQEVLFFVKILIVFVQSLIIFFKEKPDVIISTGALATVPIMLISKVFRRKIIFIESFSKINTPTLTGKISYKFADLFIIQWDEMKQHYPNAKYGGGIY